MTIKLTPEDVAMLQRPYHANAVKWLPIGKLTAKGINMMPHVDASLVIERLNVVDPCWTEETLPMLLGVDPADPSGLKHQAPWRCVLTVKSVTRAGVGQLDVMSAKLDGKSWKAGESDALKRAALKFGLGAYLRAIPVTWLNTTEQGKPTFRTFNEKFTGLTPVGKQLLRAAYEKIVTHPAFALHYGAVLDYGDLTDDAEDPVIVAEEPEAAVREDAVDVLVLLSRFTGRDTPEAAVRATAAGAPFRKLLPSALTSIKQALGCSAEDTERLRVAAISASEGDDAAMLALTDGLETLAAMAEAPAEDEQSVMPV